MAVGQTDHALRIHRTRQTHRLPLERGGRIWVEVRLPVAEVVEEDRGVERVGGGDVAYLRRGVDQATGFVGGEPLRPKLLGVRTIP